MSLTEHLMPFDDHRQETTRGERPYSPLQLLFLLRLARFLILRQRNAYSDIVLPDDWRMKLINKSIYSSYCDCVEQGLSGDAQALFEQDKKANRS